MAERQYEIVLLGATGYTGQLAAKYVQQHVSTDLVWAIAGRDESKLRKLAQELKIMNPDRIQPAIEVASLDDTQLTSLALKAKILMTTLGPYAKFGEPVVKACVEAGTHYLDVTGEITFTYDMMRKYDKAARAKGICLVPQCGIDSVPSDTLAYLCAKAMRDNLNVGLRECVASLQEMSGMLSGGTTTSLIGLWENYPSSYMKASLEPLALSAVERSGGGSHASAPKLGFLGTRHVPDLGVLTTSAQAMTDIGLVYRSWSLFDGGAYYGKDFVFDKLMRVGNRVSGALLYYTLQTMLAGFNLSTFRSLVKKFLFEQGVGPDLDKAAKDRLIYKAIGVADDGSGRRSFATYRWDGSIYYMSGVTLTEAALVLARGGDCLAKRVGGMVTPATLEMEYINRLQKAGIQYDWGIIEA